MEKYIGRDMKNYKISFWKNLEKISEVLGGIIVVLVIILVLFYVEVLPNGLTRIVF